MDILDNFNESLLEFTRQQNNVNHWIERLIA